MLVFSLTDGVFKMRQEKAAMLKVQIESAEKLSESELSELRADVKVRCPFQAEKLIAVTHD